MKKIVLIGGLVVVLGFLASPSFQRLAEPLRASPASKPLAPALTWTTYNDRMGLSFEYPSNWFIVAPPNPGEGMVGWSISVSNSDPHLESKGTGNFGLDPFAVDITVQPSPLAGYKSVDDYIDVVFRPNDSLISREHTKIKGDDAVQVVSRDPNFPNRTYVVIIVPRGNKMYSIAVFTPESIYIGVLKHILGTINLP